MDRKITNAIAPTGYDALRPIQPTGYAQWDIYIIVRRAFCPYRGLRVVSPELAKDTFVKEMQFNNYARIDTQNTNTGQPVTIAILERNEKGTNEIATISEKFKLFLNSVKGGGADIIVISPCDVHQHVLNLASELSQGFRTFAYHYDRFRIVVPLGPFTSRHTVLTDAEARDVIEYFNLKKELMKRIQLDDPQIVWLGATLGQVVRIDRITPLGRGTDYRVVARAAAL